VAKSLVVGDGTGVGVGAGAASATETIADLSACTTTLPTHAVLQRTIESLPFVLTVMFFAVGEALPLCCTFALLSTITITEPLVSFLRCTMSTVDAGSTLNVSAHAGSASNARSAASALIE